MRVCVSACLLGERCKYNGGDNLVPGLAERLADSGAEVVAVCPEMLGGLPCPRPAAEIVRGEASGGGTAATGERSAGTGERTAGGGATRDDATGAGERGRGIAALNGFAAARGLLVPGERVLTAAGDDVTQAFERGARRALMAALGNGASLDLAILQPRSPSCGVHQVYDGTFSGRLIPGSGLFARLLRESGVRVVEPADWLAR